MRHAIKTTLVALVLALSFAAPVAAGPFEDGLAAFKRGDYATAFRLWRPLAAQGDAAVQYGLGDMYASGLGVPQDDAAAVRWYRQAADQGNAAAQLSLGFMYDKGRGVPQDDAAAVRWYRQAADQGNALAQFHLGVRYDDGRGVPQDDAEAGKWYRKAADQGDALAQSALGLMYANGRGVPQDYVQAHKWFNLAGARFPASDAEHRNEAVKLRDAVAAMMAPAQIAEAQAAGSRVDAEMTSELRKGIRSGRPPAAGSAPAARRSP